MNTDISSIFTKNMEHIVQLEKAIKNIRSQNYNQGLRYYQSIIMEFMKTIELIFSCQDFLNQQYIVVDKKAIVQVLESMVDAQENEDYVLLADLLELQLIPFLVTIQNVIQQTDGSVINPVFEKANLTVLQKEDYHLYSKLGAFTSPDSKEYKIENTSIGAYTLKICLEKEFYMHSNGNPYKEADIFVEAEYDPEVHHYIVFGLGLAYHPIALLLKNPINKVEVFEMDINIIKMALGFQNMADLLASKRLVIYYDPDLEMLKKKLSKKTEDTIFLLHQPSILNIRNKEIRHSVEDYFMFHSSLKNQGKMLSINFKENIKLNDPSVEVLREELEGKNLIIVAGGPSLDKNIAVLQTYYHANCGSSKIKEYKIIVVGTVLQKVLDLNIVPDYVIISDAQPHTKKQIEQVDTKIVPLIYLSTVTYEVPKNYVASRYIVFQENFQEAEKYSKKEDVRLFQTGGSVVTLALDLGLKMSCSSIVFVGLDLAYTDFRTHATNTMSGMLVDALNQREVLSIDGDVIQTSKNLDSYRKWIERRITNEKQIELIDATEGGAFIQGTVIRRLSEILV